VVSLLVIIIYTWWSWQETATMSLLRLLSTLHNDEPMSHSKRLCSVPSHWYEKSAVAMLSVVLNSNLLIDDKLHAKQYIIISVCQYAIEWVSNYCPACAHAQQGVKQSVGLSVCRLSSAQNRQISTSRRLSDSLTQQINWTWRKTGFSMLQIEGHDLRAS
jgi:hypothetical protein